MALPISIYDRENRVFSNKVMLKTHFYSKFDGSNEKLLSQIFIRRLSKILFDNLCTAPKQCIFSFILSRGDILR